MLDQRKLLLELCKMENLSFLEDTPLLTPNNIDSEKLIEALMSKHNWTRKKCKNIIKACESDNWLDIYTPSSEATLKSKPDGKRMIEWRYFWHSYLETLGFWKVIAILAIFISAFSISKESLLLRGGSNLILMISKIQIKHTFRFIEEELVSPQIKNQTNTTSTSNSTKSQKT
ncbi:hypothetical protein HOH87_00580 [bacterium]|jgi:hypothetical protein|nr:hypothetical protein [bacterium]